MFVLSISELSEVGMVRIKITINSIDRLSVVNLKIIHFIGIIDFKLVHLIEPAIFVARCNNGVIHFKF